MDKRQLIEAIRQFNPSATVAFLEQFDAPALEQYRARLADTQSRAPQISSWVKPSKAEYRMVS